MQDQEKEALKIHVAMKELQRLADELSSKGRILHSDLSLTGMEVPEPIAQLRTYGSSLWRQRLALMWDMLPSCRQAALQKCRQKLSPEWSRSVDLWIQDPDFNKCVKEANDLLMEDDLSSQQFVSLVTQLATIVSCVTNPLKHSALEAEQILYAHIYESFITCI